MTEEKKKSGPSILRTKAEKRSRELGAVEGMSRRRFLTFLGTGSAALAAGSAGILTGCSEGQETASEGAGEGSGGEETTQAAPASGNGQPFFTSIEATDEDDLIVPEGFEYTIIRRSEDPMGGDMIFGDHADFIAYFAIDAQDGGDNSEDGLLWVNHEYINPLFWSNYDDPYGESETEKTVEQINKEKSGVGGAVIRVRMEDGEWTFVEDDEMNRRVDATTPMDVTGPASGAEIMQGATEVIGSMGNCSGGVTPWNTVLS
ncbi:MAG: DUF839 domain-containing protein [Rubrobacter sp.]|nr:DUF839 domain-containing protein [Rubrobacter sp.]